MRVVAGENRVVWSASDLKAAAECEFAWSRALDAKLHRVPRVDEPEDAMLARAARLGDRHEARVLDDYLTRFGEGRLDHTARPGGVIVLPKVSSIDADALASVVADTQRALRSQADVVFQAAFSTGEFVGFADFLCRDDQGRWRVQDTKLARTARVTALMQLAAYVDQLDRWGVPRSDTVELLLGDGSTSVHRVDDILPLFRVRRARLRALIADRRVGDGAAGTPLAWGDDRGDLEIRACGRCTTCTEQVELHRDLLLVGRMRPVHRTRLRAAGIMTVEQLADASDPPADVNRDVFEALRAQARLQLRSVEGQPPALDVYYPQAVHTLPRPSRGDIFFDFEGDPLYTEPVAPGEQSWWNLDYLFGWTDNEENYTALWAHSFAEERAALEQFLAFVQVRRQTHPDMHVYHYAPYETAHLVSMAARHGVGENELDALLRAGVFVDLYPIVLRTVRIGSASYSIKSLEPLYMGAEVRTADVKKGDDSIERYVAARQLRDAAAANPDSPTAADDRATADAILADLADYNRYDCVSTRRLRDWLIGLARDAQVLPAPPDEPDEVQYVPSPLSQQLLDDAARDRASGGDGETYRVAAAALDYYPREAKSFWVAHFERLRQPVSMWESTRDVVRVDAAQSVVRRDWSRPESGRGADSRDIEIRGQIAPGTTVSVGAQPFALYPVPAPFLAPVPSRVVHVPRAVEVIEVLDDGYVVTERALDGQTWSDMPLALTPAAPPRVASLQKAIEEWASAVHHAAPGFPRDAATDILRRIPPRTRSGAPLPAASGGDMIDAIVRGVLDLDHSYVAVQGPPGTGKTYTGSRVISRLVNEHGFRVGVVAQSHAIVETLLERIVDDGVPSGQVAKAPKDPHAETAYTRIRKTGMASFLAENTGRGVVVGGTAWDFSNPTRVGRGDLDLIVVDEAGQFSLANTIAVAAGAQRLLLLGDPQQLPQVSQGTHSAPVDTSALGWVMGDDEVLGADYGYFLGESWRMHPAVAEPVSHLAYAGRLVSAPVASLRGIDGIEPGLHVHAVTHRGNATDSAEEAAEVVRIVQHVMGRTVFDGARTDAAPDAPPCLLDEEDIIVVAPYNAQKQRVQEALSEAGFSRIPVGTVDNFQGKEALVSITTLAASSGRDAPRGPEFLLLQNRLNVAISRAKVAAYLVYSPGLLNDLPFTAEGVTRLSAFARLIGADRE